MHHAHEIYSQLQIELRKASSANNHENIKKVQQMVNTLQATTRNLFTNSPLQNHFNPFGRTPEELNCLIPALVENRYINYKMLPTIENNLKHAEQNSMFFGLTAEQK